MPDELESHVFEYSEGEWWAECRVCSEWVSVGNDTERIAQMKIGRHLQNDHPDRGAGSPAK